MDNNLELRLLDAMAMEEEYRLLREDWEAKTAFDYVGKLQELGFADTVEYEYLKSYYLFTKTNFNILEIGSNQFLKELGRAIRNKTETIFIVTPIELMAWIGTDAYNADYCKANNIPAYKVDYNGGTIVTSPEDVAIGLLTFNQKFEEVFANLIYKEINKYFLSAEFVGNDILVDGYKVFGIGRKNSDGMYLSTYQITFKANQEAISAICLTESDKSVMGLSELGSIDKLTFIETVKSWLL